MVAGIRRRPVPAPAPVLRRRLVERQRLAFVDAQPALLPQLAAQQAHRLEVAVDFFVAAGDEAGHEHALKRVISSLGWTGVSIGISK